MRNLINFLLKNSSWFVFIALEVICIYFIFSENSYQNSVYLNSSTEITGRVYAVTGSISSYFGLRSENEQLLRQNATLQAEVRGLKNRIFDIEADSSKSEAFLHDSLNQKIDPSYIIARVEKNSTFLLDNYMIINKGETNGVKADMGVVSQWGIVGVVLSASANYAIVQPVLNPRSRFSCKKRNSSAVGILVWEGGDPRYATVTQYPKYEEIQVGDTIVTSGFSDYFPEGMMVGVVEGYKSEADDNFNSLKLKLSTDFVSIKNVFLIKNTNDEIKQLEELTTKDVKK
jgi:rod shape-determining protein MreC